VSESRKRTVAKLLHLSPDNAKYVHRLADERAPGAKGGARAQSSVVRDALDFTEAHHPLFLTWLTARREGTPDRKE
jgi:hypothetical protein